MLLFNIDYKMHNNSTVHHLCNILQISGGFVSKCIWQYYNVRVAYGVHRYHKLKCIGVRAYSYASHIHVNVNVRITRSIYMTRLQLSKNV